MSELGWKVWRTMSALDEVRGLAESIARRRSLQLWDVEMGPSVVRVFVDSDDGVDIDTIAAVSEELSRALDLRDAIPGRYTLEVSSPGLERALRSPEHFERSVGATVTVKTKERLLADSHRIDGSIVRASPESVRLATAAGEVDVPYDSIRSARTIFEWK